MSYLPQVLAAYKITTAARKTAVLAELNTMLEDLNFEYETLIRNLNKISTSADALSARKAAKESEITSYTAIIAALSAGSVKNDFIEKKTIAEQDLYRLNLRSVDESRVAELEMRKQDIYEKIQNISTELYQAVSALTF